MAVLAPERIVASGGAPKRHVRVWLIALVIGMIVGAGVAGLLSSDSRPGPGWHRIGSLSELRSEGVLVFDEPGVILVEDDGRVLALSAVDGRGQPVTYCEASGYFQDDNHGSMFDRYGRYAHGPAPHGLDRFAVVVLDDDVFVDRTQVTPGPERFNPKPIRVSGPFCPAAGTTGPMHS